MTTQEQAPDGATGQQDSQPATVSRDELNQAIARRQAALEQARSLQAQLDEIRAAEAQRAREEAEAQGKFKELAEAAEARAAELEAKHAADSKRLEALTARHRATVEARLAALPEATRKTLSERLGEAPGLDALESAVELAESFLPTETQRRNVGGAPSAGRQSPVGGTGKASAADIAKMTRAERTAYLAKHYSR